eukprot:3724077-Amphidinium_carterae.1
MEKQVHACHFNLEWNFRRSLSCCKHDQNHTLARRPHITVKLNSKARKADLPVRNRLCFIWLPLLHSSLAAL